MAQGNAGGEIIILPEDNVFSDSARFYANYYREILADLLNFPLDTTVVIFIADSEEEFLSRVGSSFPDWGAAAASIDRAAIIIKSPKYIRVGKSFRELIGHELTHIMLHRASGSQWLPRWIHEGLSMRVSGEWSIGQDILVARAVWTNRLINLYRLEGLTEFSGAEANLAYTESYLAASELVKASDKYLLADLLGLYRDNRDFYRSFEIVTNNDYHGWTTNWYERMTMRYHFFLFLLDVELFWLLIPLFFILLVILKKRQNAKVKKRWRIEDRINPPDEGYNQYYDGYYDDKDKV
ncbi:MAG: hypothetical protein JSW64_13170 [Candidatus Zixiibacteriota bacterium]|nr:MAG: hypothetical protein JSW64_13170 [candidate division Zixibacteria bacterium]